MPEKLQFLTSLRFWALVGIAIIGVLSAEEILTPDVATAIITILGGFIGIKTIDRFGEKAGGQ